MDLNITSPKIILQELTEIDNYLNITISEQAEEAVLRGNDLAAYIARSGKLLADAKYHLNEKMKAGIQSILELQELNPRATATAVNGLVKSLCKEEQYLVDWAERVNRSATHQLEWCRSLLSKAKEEMKIAGYSSQR